jgi:hypothetical protein
VYPEIVGGFNFTITDLHEYFTVGLEYYLFRSSTLKKYDPMLFSFIEEMLNE